MSSSLEYLLANFDEEPAPRPSSMAAFSPSHHCYGNSVGIGHPWIASRASSTAAASSDSATTTRETMAMAMAMEPPRPWNSHPLLPPPHHHESPRASTGGGTLHSPDTTQRHRHPPRDSPAAVPRGLHIHGGFDYLFGYPTVPAHGAAARTSLEEAMDVMSSSFGYQPQSQRGRTLFPAEGCPALEAERAAASMDGGSIDSDDALGEDDGDSIATIDFTSSGDESARDEDDVVDEVEERADVKGGRPRGMRSR
ncbi:hypothetical protein HJC23_001320 [Cyclotella cryptica]|uniref:Uncharacterized protein n=1 Tax=Cyclotella cryptica TaxID=29204 RepID=A0ABD3NXG0_9STRA